MQVMQVDEAGVYDGPFLGSSVAGMSWRENMDAWMGMLVI